MFALYVILLICLLAGWIGGQSRQNARGTIPFQWYEAIVTSLYTFLFISALVGMFLVADYFRDSILVPSPNG